MYPVAAVEKSKNPPRTAMPNPIQFQTNSASESSEIVRCCLRTPRRRKSRATFVPTHKDSPVKWIAWTGGYAQSEPAIFRASGVLCSQLAKATSNLNISVNLQFAYSPSLGLAHNIVTCFLCRKLHVRSEIYPTPVKAGTSTPTRMAAIHKAMETRATNLPHVGVAGSCSHFRTLRWTTRPNIVATKTTNSLKLNHPLL